MSAARSEEPVVWSLDAVGALPAVIPAALADEILGISQTLGKTLRASGRYPVRVIRLGRLQRVSTADLLQWLGAPVVHRSDEEAVEAATAGEPELRPVHR